MSARRDRDPMQPDRAVVLFAAVAAHHGETWTFDSSPKFGANTLRIKGKIYAALTRKRQLLLKLPPARIAELLKAKRAQRMQSGGRVMKGWVTLAPDRRSEWIALADETRRFVTAETKPKGNRHELHPADP